jgi:hypothetical protein
MVGAGLVLAAKTVKGLILVEMVGMKTPTLK